MRGKVLLVPFPFDDLAGAKVQPAVCLTDPVGQHRHIVIAFVSSVVRAVPLPTDLGLDPAAADFTGSGLRVRSVLRLHRLVTITTGIVRRELGALSSTHIRAMDKRLRMLFGLYTRPHHFGPCHPF